MSTEFKLGAKVRSLRRKEGLTQTDLASKLEISPSYLNLIEHNQRPLPAHLLVKVAQAFKVDLVSFADDNSSRIAGDLQEMFGDSLFEAHSLTTAAVRRYDKDRKILALSEVLPPWSRLFQIAHQLGLIEAARVIDSILERSANLLTAAESVKLCRIALANYFAAAVLMPYDEFLRTA